MSKDQIKARRDTMQAYRDVFNTPQGTVVLKDLIKSCGLYTITGVQQDSQLQHTEGSRDMVRRIISILAVDEEKLTKLAIGEQ